MKASFFVQTCLLISLTTVTKSQKSNCKFGTEVHGLHNYYRCECTETVPKLDRNFVTTSCDKTSFWSCDRCQISDISNDTFAGLTVYVLSLRRNKLLQLDAWTKSLKILEVLILEGNDLPVLKNGSFEHLPTLIELDLSYNQITIVEADSFRNLTSLRYLNMSNNGLESLPNNVFAKHVDSTLEDLRVAHNRLKTIHAGLFTRLTRLVLLDLSFNEIASLVPEVFFNLWHLETLLLNDNLLYNFAATSLRSYAPDVRFLSLDGNRWNCAFLSNQLLRLQSVGNIKIRHGVDLESKNVLGIGCESDKETVQGNVSQIESQSVEVVSTDKSEQYLRSIYVLVVVICACLCLLTLLVNWKCYLFLWLRMTKREFYERDPNAEIMNDF